MAMIQDSILLPLPKIEDPRGNLSVIEQNRQIPFEIKRAYWIYDVPGGCSRGGHSYKENQEFIVALSGSFDVILDDGKESKTFSLNRSYMGLYVPKGIWRTMSNFSTNSLALVLASNDYDPNDYVINYEEFKSMMVGNRQDISLSEPVPSQKILEGDTLFEFKGGESVFDCALRQLTKMHDPEGNLTYVYENIHVPFPINRVFYSYDIPGGEDRGAHAHKKCHQFIIAASGAFEVVLDDGVNKRTVTLNRPFWGLHVPPGIWASEQGFSSGSICLVLASHGYDESDYIRSYDVFMEYVKTKK